MKFAVMIHPPPMHRRYTTQMLWRLSDPVAFLVRPSAPSSAVFGFYRGQCCLWATCFRLN